MTVFQCTCVTDTIKDSPLACVDDACLAREKKNSCKNAREARENTGEANHAQQTNRQLRRLLGLSPPLTVYQ